MSFIVIFLIPYIYNQLIYNISLKRLENVPYILMLMIFLLLVLKKN